MEAYSSLIRNDPTPNAISVSTPEALCSADIEISQLSRKLGNVTHRLVQYVEKRRVEDTSLRGNSKA